MTDASTILREGSGLLTANGLDDGTGAKPITPRADQSPRPPRGITKDPAWRERFRTLHGQKVGRNAMAKELGVGVATVTRVAKEMGLEFDRSMTAVAVEARQVDMADQRTRAIQRLYARAHAGLDALEADQWQTILKGEYGVERARFLDFVPSRDLKDQASAIGSLLASAARLEQITNPDRDRQKGLLGEVADLITVMGATRQGPDAELPQPEGAPA